MYTVNDAKKKMSEYVNFLNEIFSETYPDLGINVILLDNLTKNYDFGWVFFYQSDNDSLIAGNGPIIVENKTLDMYETMTSLSFDDNVKIFLKDKNKLSRIEKDEEGIWDTVNLD